MTPAIYSYRVTIEHGRHGGGTEGQSYETGARNIREVLDTMNLVMEAKSTTGIRIHCYETGESLTWLREEAL